MGGLGAGSTALRASLPEPTSWNRIGRLVGTSLHRADLDVPTREAMYRVLDRSFQAHPRSVFEADLEQKDRVILLHDADTGDLKGFSTLAITVEEIAGRRIAVLYNGDTVLDREAWGTPLLSRVWLKIAFDARRDLGLQLYWLLICSGYRTYRFLPVYWRDFWPRHDAATPGDVQCLLERLASQRFGQAFRDGVVRLPGGYLREGIGDVDEDRARNAHVAFFVERNPGHVHGEELVCLTELSPENLTPGGMRIYRAIP